MAADDLAEFIPILRARLECGNLHELGPWAKDDWYIGDVAGEARYLLREVDRFAAMEPSQRRGALDERREVARRSGTYRPGWRSGTGAGERLHVSGRAAGVY